jgi:hypothetical protein
MAISTPRKTLTEALSHNQDVLNDLVDLGHELARAIVEQTKTRVMPAATAALAFERVTRCVRRCAWLVRELAKPLNTTDRVAARKQIIRTVEDTIQRTAEHPDDAEALHGELRERLDSPDLEDDIHSRPIIEIIADICRDLGLAHSPGSHPWKRRTPADLARLVAYAAQPVPPPSQTHRRPAAHNSG